MGKPYQWVQVSGIGFGIAAAAALSIWPDETWLAIALLAVGLILIFCPVVLCVSIKNIFIARIKLSLPILGMIVFGVGFFLSLAWYAHQKANPIIWDFSGFIGGSKRDGVQAHAGVFQVNGINRSNDLIQFSDIQIISLVTGKSKPVTINTNISGDNPYVAPSEHSPIPPGVKIYAHALFYDPANPKSEFGLEGVPQDIFMKNFGEFNFVVKYAGGKTYIHKFSSKEIKAQFDRL